MARKGRGGCDEEGNKVLEAMHTGGSAKLAATLQLPSVAARGHTAQLHEPAVLPLRRLRLLHVRQVSLRLLLQLLHVPLLA